MNRINIRPLSINEGYTGRKFKTEAHRAWHKSVLLMLPKIVLPEPPYEIYFKFGFASAASDYDNCIKFFQDSLAKKYNFNDKLIRRAVIETEIVGKGKEYIEWNITHLTTI